METNGSSPKNPPQDIQRALQKHDAVLRLSYVEIVSGINRLLRQGIPKEVISQVVTQEVEAVAKDFNPPTSEDFYSRTETQPDAPNGNIPDSFAELAWTDVTGKVGGLRFLEVSAEFRGKLHSWLRGNSVPIGSVAQHAPAAATPMDRMEQPPRETLRELLKPAKEGQFRTLRANAMRTAVDAAAPLKKKEPAPRKSVDTPVLSYAVSEIISREVKPRLPKPAIVERAREASRRYATNVLRAAGAIFVVMLLVILFLFQQGAGDSLIWLEKKISGEPRTLPIQRYDGQVQTPSPMADTSKVDAQREQESGVVKKSVLAPLSTTVPGHIVAPARTSQPSATGEFLSGTQGAVKKGSSVAGSHPEAIRPKVVTADKAETVRLLWAEVARGKISSEVVLADMYVHGDRVPKNCAQARVLLSAAAKKGNKIAVRKLIDLDSEGGGCSNSAPQ